MTWSCPRCGKPFLTERERDIHVGTCGLGYTPKPCLHCRGTGITYYHAKCPNCNGSGYETPKMRY